jgi:hypothetical protein
MSNINPATWASWNLRPQDKSYSAQLQLLLAQISQWALGVQGQLTQTGIASILNGNAALSVTALKQVSVFSNETTNRTTSLAGVVSAAFNLNVTGAINYTLNLTNVSPGSIIGIRLGNLSGAGRTFTITASNPASVSYTVALVGTGAPVTCSSGAAIANGAFWNGVGNVNSAQPSIILFGGVGT